MSYDSISSKHTCPCGKGTYTEIEKFNDWSQCDSNWIMDCTDCSSMYRLHTYSKPNSILYERCQRWIKNSTFEKAEFLMAQSNNLQIEVVELSVQQYLPTLCLLFEGMTKKEIWKILHKNIKPFKGLSQFYKDINGRSNSEYLHNLFTFYNIPFILKILNENNPEIEDLINKSNELNLKARNILQK